LGRYLARYREEGGARNMRGEVIREKGAWHKGVVVCVGMPRSCVSARNLVYGVWWPAQVWCMPAQQSMALPLHSSSVLVSVR